MGEAIRGAPCRKLHHDSWAPFVAWSQGFSAVFQAFHQGSECECFSRYCFKAACECLFPIITCPTALFLTIQRFLSSVFVQNKLKNSSPYIPPPPPPSLLFIAFLYVLGARRGEVGRVCGAPPQSSSSGTKHHAYLHPCAPGTTFYSPPSQSASEEGTQAHSTPQSDAKESLREVKRCGQSCLSVVFQLGFIFST